MSHLKSGAQLLLLSSMFACGNQLVEFGVGGQQDATTGEDDASSADAGLTPTDDGGMGSDTGTATDDSGIEDSGVDDSGVFSPDTGVGAPTIISTFPDNDATGVALTSSVTATFSEAMDPATLNNMSFRVGSGSTNVTGVVTYVPSTRTAVFIYGTPFVMDRVYTATITTAAEDLSGVALAADYHWTFTTTASQPRVVSNTPLNLATNVSINVRPTVTFNVRMDPSTINTLSFTVRDGALAVPGSVTLNGAGNRATFDPTAPLDTNRLYTVRVSTAAEDMSGRGLASDHVWSFTTATCGEERVVLGTAANFAVLAGSTVTNSGLTTVTGNLGVSPGTAITGFPPGVVIGTQHSANPTSAQGIADLTVAYNEAAGRMLCRVTVAGNLGGMTLTPGLYHSATSLEISSGTLTLDAQGDSEAIFVFQMAQTLITTVGRQVVLINGANAANIFWQVGTSATLGGSSVFQGTIMADQAITLNTGATLNGRALARITAVSLNSSIVARPLP